MRQEIIVFLHTKKIEMNLKELQTKLMEAYSQVNLNKISLTLINLYKNKQYPVLQKIADLISDYVHIEITSGGKGFSKLISLYHPDRMNYYMAEINNLGMQNNLEGLLKHSHILKLDQIEEIAETLNSYEDIDYSPVYEWDFNEDGFSIIRENEPVNNNNYESDKYDFYDAVKIRQYGTTDIEFPSYYLEDIEEFELATSNINDLDGVQFCIHAVNLDLSDNNITDLTPLIGLKHIEELNLSDNEIDTIEALSKIKNLRRVYLSNNHIEDISPLMELINLDYVDLSGNNIDPEQIRELTEAGVTVDY